MNTLLEILKIILLGIIQGITEWLPISSTGHMLLFNNWIPLDFSDAFVNLFMVVIQLGSILAVIVLYFGKLFPWSRQNKSNPQAVFSLWFKIIVATLPLVVLGLLLDDLVDAHLKTPLVIAMMLIVYGILFILIEKRKKRPHITEMIQLSYGDAIMIGLFQVLAIVPGTSRSGATIVGALLLGLSRPVAAEFSFYLAIPAMFGASFLKLIKAGFVWTGFEWAMLGLGSFVAFIVSLFAIRFLMDFVRRNSFTAFAYYRIALGALILGLWLI